MKKEIVHILAEENEENISLDIKIDCNGILLAMAINSLIRQLGCMADMTYAEVALNLSLANDVDMME